jgi:predicted nucleic acid-binding protein
MIYLLDTSALMVLYRKEAGADRLLSLFDDPQHNILICAISVAEFGRKLREVGLNRSEVEHTLDMIIQVFARVVAVDESVARASLTLTRNLSARLPLADALIAAAALSCKACLVHKDKHLEAIPQDILATLTLAQ